MKYKDILFNWIVDLEQKSHVEEVNNSIHVKSSVVNLPKLEVPHFYGNCENWISFKELFKFSILDNKSISDLEKLQNLQASVHGEAAKLIRGFAITVDNLKNCWDILCSRYENKRQLALSQINKLFSIKISRANTSKLLLEIIDICNEVIRNLKTLDLETNSLTELIIINFLISKVDACISQRWELSLENNKIPTLEEFRVFIEREARGLNELKFVKPDIKKGNVKPLNSFNKSNVNTTVVKCNQVKSGVKPDVVKGTPIMRPKGTPSALPTKLGHLLSGTINTQYNQNSSLICHTLLNIDHYLKQFWELESVPKNIPSKDEDELCEFIFVNSHIHNADGRCILKLPFRDDSSLGDSKEGAFKRFYSLERKLHSNNQLKKQYTEFMEEYQNLGQMTSLTSDVKFPHYFLPHHGVNNDNSSTTKLRVVFDGSCKSTNGNSLNDILLTVTYGTSCAPFLAIRTLKQLCEDEKHRFPQAAKLAKDHFYVDDLLAGADSLDSARKIVHELQNLMSAGGFELRKWSCTHPEVLSDLPNTLKTNISSHSFDDKSTQKILGLFWNLNEDSFKIRAVLLGQVSTKGQMLSIIARTFDPLKFVSPSTIILKIILQYLWKLVLDWDDEISSDILNRWNRFQAEISCLKQIKFPRKSLNITHDTYLWCDSTITLSWVNNPPIKGNQFVQHRVGKIHTLTSKESWHHIPGKLNPADWATRGLYPKHLKNSEWVAGPKWLHDFHPSSNSFIPFSEQPVPLVPIDQSESLSNSVVLSTCVDYSLSFLDKFSSYMKVVRTVAWIFRFYHSSKSVSKVTGPLYTHELETSIKKVVKLLQNGEYHTELNLLKCNKPLPKSSKLQSLNVFLDSEGILRVGECLRLQQTLKFEQKHPMFIPKNHHFTSLIIKHFHKVNFHAGQELDLSLIRQRFWIPHGKSAVKKELQTVLNLWRNLSIK
ncbi:integrase catalytic domain-containing protein [Trichonephila clavipes]|nr:integrase catalytic domain-containing protein [Trichonephila clavipes]